MDQRSLLGRGNKIRLCPRVSSFFLALGKRELVYVRLVHLFVCFARVSFGPFFFLLVSGLAVVCYCGTPWTFLLRFLVGEKMCAKLSKYA